MITEQEKRNWIRLIQTENIGPATFWDLLKQFKTAGNALQSIANMPRQKTLKIPTEQEAEKEQERAQKENVQIITAAEKNYPEWLKQISDAPPLIYVKGEMSETPKQTVAIVGAREASTNSKNFARKLAYELSEAGLIIVSGLARGADTAAHQGCLDHQGMTWAVLANGLDEIYPPENATLANQIINHGGALISEKAFGTKPQSKFFPQRNRIISGLSQGTIVVAGAERSGSLVTARLALEQGRELFAVPGFPTDPYAAGPNKLLQSGAHLVTKTEDVLEVLQKTFYEKDKQVQEELIEETVWDKERANDLQERVWRALSTTPTQQESLLNDLKISAQELAQTLVHLELAGKVERLPGSQIIKIWQGRD